MRQKNFIKSLKKKMNDSINLNLACGRDYRTDCINIDNKQMYHGSFEVDLDADLKTLKWEDDTVTTIICSHFIIYLNPEELEVLLKRWYGWLKKGGSIYIESGNIMAVCDYILKAKSVEQLHDKNGIMQLYGIDDHIWNKWAWCPQSVTQIMEKVGFKDIETRQGFFHLNPQRDFLTIGYK